MTTPSQIRRLFTKAGLTDSLPVAASSPVLTVGASVEASHRAGRVWSTTFTVAADVITITDADTAGAHGSLELGTFPAGAVRFLGATTNVAITAATGIGATGAVVCAVGTTATATDNATLTTTEANIIPSTSVTLVASVGTFRGESTGTEGATTIDGTTTAAKLHLNFAVSAADATANSSLTCTGTVTVTWVNLGDN